MKKKKTDTRRTVFTVVKAGEVIDTFGSIKNLANYLEVNQNKLYHIFSRKKENNLQLSEETKIFKTKLV